MSRRTRIFVGILLIYVAGIAFLLYRVVGDIDPRYRESAEESLVETSQLMASMIELDVMDGAIVTTRLEPLFRSVYARHFSAQIYNLHKTRVELRAYVTDARGTVLFDSLERGAGQDYSRWSDVRLTLEGRYGARTTRDVADDPLTSVMYVAAPIRWNGEIVGVVSLGKPVQSFGQFVDDARSRTLWVGVGSALALLLLTIMVSVWLVRPFSLIRDYIAWTRAQPRLGVRRMAGRAIDTLRAGLHEMRDAMTGHNPAVDYVQTLTHEIKSPLSAIRGASELLQEPGMPAPERERFLANITRETQRIQEIVDRMMELTTLETRRVLERTESVPLGPLIEEIVAEAQPVATARGLRLQLDLHDDAHCDGDPFLLRRAISNLLDNALDFAPRDSSIEIALTASAHRVVVSVRDHGPGIPDYAQDKVFEKFYSLARPHSGKKSTGLGLAFVKEIASQHGGSAALANARGGGTLASLTLPVQGRR